MAETHGLITDDDLDSLDSLDVDTMTVAVSDLEGLARRLRARWVADALDELVGRLKEHKQWCRDHVQDQLDSGRIAGVSEALIVARTLAGEYRDGTR